MQSSAIRPAERRETMVIVEKWLVIFSNIPWFTPFCLSLHEQSAGSLSFMREFNI
jgi:hypothetical protein